MSSKPKIFISHCQDNMAPTEYAMRIIRLLGCEPIIAEDQAKGSRTVNEVVVEHMENCDAVIVIATADVKKDENKYTPSSGVIMEIGRLSDSDKFKNRYFIVKEDNVVLSAMSAENRYSFTAGNFGPIAHAILLELGAMGLFQNYHEMPGSQMQMHTLMETLDSLKKIKNNGHLPREMAEPVIKQAIQDLLDRIFE